MANKTISGSGAIASTDYRTIKWTGKTKDGKSVIITLNNAICLDNIDWTMQDKDEVVAQVTYTATYTEDDRDGSNGEPWSIEYDGTATSNIILGYGVFSIDGTDVGLCRGGGKFTIEREYRNIEADGDKGAVKDRISLDTSNATLQMNVLDVLGNVDKLYPGINVTE